MANRVLIVGASRGVGLQLARELKSRKYEVLAGVRTTNTELNEMGVEVIEGIDTAKDECVDRLKQKVGDRPIETLVYNSGIAKMTDSIPDNNMDAQNINEHLNTNATGAVRVVKALMENITPGEGREGKVILISSEWGSLEATRKDQGFPLAYRMSKAALGMAGMCLGADLKPRGIGVLLVHPGYVATDMTSQFGSQEAGSGAISPHVSAHGIADRIDEFDLSSSCTFQSYDGSTVPF